MAVHKEDFMYFVLRCQQVSRNQDQPLSHASSHCYDKDRNRDSGKATYTYHGCIITTGTGLRQQHLSNRKEIVKTWEELKVICITLVLWVIWVGCLPKGSTPPWQTPRNINLVTPILIGWWNMLTRGSPTYQAPLLTCPSNKGCLGDISLILLREPGLITSRSLSSYSLNVSRWDTLAPILPNRLIYHPPNVRAGILFQSGL